MTPTMKTLARQLTDAELAAIKKDATGVAPLKEIVRRLLRHIEATKPALRACETAREAFVKIKKTLMTDASPPDFSGDVTEYRVSGNAMYHAINAARAALAELEKVRKP